tara:strand:- start:484 stop:1032 length:549 start_codon:yes stop_codon:yes gene_type:complete
MTVKHRDKLGKTKVRAKTLRSQKAATTTAGFARKVTDKGVCRDALTGRYQVVRDERMNPVSVVMAFDAFKRAFPSEAANIIADQESKEDAELIRLADESESEESFPMEIVKRLSDGESPIKVYREYRDLTQTDIAEQAEVSTNYISMIETGRKTASRKLQAKLAGILDVDYEDLETWSTEVA